MEIMIQASYFLAAVLFILGLKQMSSPVTARRGIIWSGVGMILATVVTFWDPSLHGVSNYVLMVIAIVIGGGYAWQKGKTVPMVDMPQMIALFNGMGGGAAGAIAAVELFSAIHQSQGIPGMGVSAILGTDVAIVAIVGAFIGTLSFSGSLIAWAKLDGKFRRTSLVPMQHWVNLILLVAVIYVGVKLFNTESTLLVLLFFALVLLLGVFVTTPVGGADMPVAISLFNALTGLAVGLEGYVLDNAAMIIAGTVVGSAGTLLTQLMAKAMNRSVWNVLFGGFGQNTASAEAGEIEGSMKEVQSQDAAIMMAYASQVIIVPGYGMAVAQAQHKVWELAELLEENNVSVKFAIHPVAGRMPGHMNVLLAEAGVPYDKIFDMDEINPDFPTTTVALVIGANDVVNPDARNDKTSPLYGMPVLDAALAENVIVVKRGKGTGFSGVENALFYQDNTQMLYGDGQKAASDLIQHLKKL
ncbi:NAD(P)(+) transhydrogenase (Re/Si-specific) subunit beta [Aestuariirhabdus sp. Z084]|uniref:NAD(P)(+) transhydrogenase (Re/Si-specific) subunit beta n=1 Tax=Aestuariirhabdus haliotis TaxID=2918751 RepID=UPI00201B40B7|nr:NAD(P)(+) transhydrogenase (Re/Si-specific) subunit beta [Aestuariirhabdus haliotis]MCL6417232.1 NAD(P)(+) transhydrogenase (Re/Si-specific) subunit beta [Aestuariirhabdus haliotis]MCL6421203.1 NAD(P)(+) transhydrogenase (Re/Si-specific) subunit beta [Aestuariirhabdus haliotis]